MVTLKPRKQIKRKNRKNKKNVQRRVMQEGSSLIKALALSRRNPWDYAACIPDLATGVGCFSVKQTVQLATGTGGSCNSVFWFPGPQETIFVDTQSTTNVPTIAGNWQGAIALANIAGLYGKYRCVSSGIRGTYTGSTFTDGGVVLFGQVSGQIAPATFNGKTLIQCQALFQKYDMCPLRNGFILTWDPVDLEDTNQFYSFDTAAVPMANGAFEPAYLAAFVFTADAAQSTLMVEGVTNYEGQFKSQTFMPGGLTEADKTAEPGWYEKTANLLRGVPQMAAGVQELWTLGRNAAPAIQYIGRAAGSLSRSAMPLLTL